jgi:hypothetical protein
MNLKRTGIKKRAEARFFIPVLLLRTATNKAFNQLYCERTKLVKSLKANHNIIAVACVAVKIVKELS